MSAAEDPIKHVVIVGGGTAGWLTASILAADHCADQEGGLKVTLIESPRVPILGVGEGTWPTIRDTLRRIGLSESEFVRRCDASFKQGSRFDGCRNGQDSYFHPFEAPPPSDDVDALAVWRAAPPGTTFADAVCPQPALCREGLAPKQPQTPEFAAVANYAFHLDAPAFAELLAEHAAAHLGVEHVVDDVTGVRRSEGGDVAALITQEYGERKADLFIDCTGMRALLIGGEMGAATTDASDVLFNDRALAIHVPHAEDTEFIEVQTNATALSAGWVWDIALQSRRGVGHVFSSEFATEDQARVALQAYLNKASPNHAVRADDARLIKFQSAYRETPWVRNVAAVGMASGFVEPLEASAIVMIELAAGAISDLLPARRDQMEGASRRFNDRLAYRWGRIVDFLKLHYILSERNEEYWNLHRDPATWSPRLRELMARWQHTPPSREDFTQTLEIFPAASYAYVLYGMEFETEKPTTLHRRADKKMAQAVSASIAERRRRLLGGLPAANDLLKHIREHGLSRV